MKLNTLDKLITVLENKTSEVKLDESIRLKALHSLDRMLELAE
jgi:quinolinate synthase